MSRLSLSASRRSHSAPCVSAPNIADVITIDDDDAEPEHAVPLPVPDVTVCSNLINSHSTSSNTEASASTTGEWVTGRKRRQSNESDLFEPDLTEQSATHQQKSKPRTVPTSDTGQFGTRQSILGFFNHGSVDLTRDSGGFNSILPQPCTRSDANKALAASSTCQLQRSNSKCSADMFCHACTLSQTVVMRHSGSILCPSYILHSNHDQHVQFGSFIVGRRFLASNSQKSSEDDDDKINTTTFQLICLNRDIQNPRDSHAIHVCAMTLSTEGWCIGLPLGFLPAKVSKSLIEVVGQSDVLCACASLSSVETVLPAVGYIPAGIPYKVDQPVPVVIILRARDETDSSMLKFVDSNASVPDQWNGMLLSLSASLLEAGPFSTDQNLLLTTFRMQSSKFDTISKTIALNDETFQWAVLHYSHCFESDQLELIAQWQRLSVGARRLLTRLNSRRGPFWRRVELVQKYAEISNAEIDELLKCGQLYTADQCITELTALETCPSSNKNSKSASDQPSWMSNTVGIYATALSCLSAPAVKLFATKLSGGKLPSAISTSQSSETGKAALLQYVSKLLNSSQKSLDGRRLVHLPSTKQALRSAISVNSVAIASRQVGPEGDLLCLAPKWMQIQKLVWAVRGDRSSGSSVASSLAASEFGNVKYAAYPLRIQQPLFASKCQLLSFMESNRLLRHICHAVEADDLDAVLPLLLETLVRLNMKKSIQAVEKLCSLPSIQTTSESSSTIISIDCDDEPISNLPASNHLTQLASSERANLMRDSSSVALEPSAPALARFTATWTLIECVYQSLKVIEKHKLFAIAVEIAEEVLGIDSEIGQSDVESSQINLMDRLTSIDSNATFTFRKWARTVDHMESCECGFQCLLASRSTIAACHSRRGALFGRLALNLSSHLKRPDRALLVCEAAIADESVKVGELFGMFARRAALKRQFEKQSKQVRLKSEPDVAESVDEFCSVVVPELMILGRATSRKAGVKSRFFGHNDQLCTVEQLVIQHFAVEGGWRGVHCENGLWSMLSSLLFVDIMFSNVADAFHIPFESAPLDWGTESFYLKRKGEIDQRLVEIESDANEMTRISALLSNAFSQFDECVVAGINWNAYTLDELQEICAAVGGKALALIARRLIVERDAWSGGLPDLLLIRQREAMLVEVKSERDRLSDQQRCWLSVLYANGVSVLVCRVREDSANLRQLSTEV